jgi:hypothetical protein
MNYVTQTYRYMIPYMSGLHMTIDGWRDNRDSDGWKINVPDKPQELSLDDDDDSVCTTDSLDTLDSTITEDNEFPDPPDPHTRAHGPEPPPVVEAKPRLFADVAALLELCQQDEAPWRRVRAKKTASVLYGFGDASGPAFGDTLQMAGSANIMFHYGRWLASITDEESSNWRELANLVEFLEEEGAKGNPTDAEVFMFTDNSSAENAIWKGTSHSRKLNALILRLRGLEMKTGMILHLVHVSGKRMITQGTDGLDPQAEGLGDEDWHDLALGSCQWEANDHPGH